MGSSSSKATVSAKSDDYVCIEMGSPHTAVGKTDGITGDKMKIILATMRVAKMMECFNVMFDTRFDMDGGQNSRTAYDNACQLSVILEKDFEDMKGYTFSNWSADMILFTIRSIVEKQRKIAGLR
jgi:hypothetical protein